ncbi:heme ABC transporter ATP-binding protein [Cochlodiniinecator piscidefendens]|uniref:heme ABC transporter ATP-binding protein n=1 Tax=Cochlodiniinecator piscidefendens TaxID=2715756 RepID=UPI0014078158|nr:heme ABC transporter ATP-binding protein [Cochlodiniinecator piscidefendens]
MLKAEEISVTFGKKPVLSGVEFQAVPGQITSIVGHNGSGKTTLLRALTGDISFEGRVFLNDENITKKPAWELASLRAVLPQATPLAFPFTVIEVVRLGLMAGVNAENANLAVRALKQVGLLGYENRFYQELSGGEQQRVQLARVLCQVWEPVLDGVPRWLFLDEPVASLDILHQLMVMQIAKSFASKGGGVIMVMHDLNLTAQFSDRVYMMKSGTVVGAGSPEEVFTDSQLSLAYSCQIDRSGPSVSTILHPAHIVVNAM